MKDLLIESMDSLDKAVKPLEASYQTCIALSDLLNDLTDKQLIEFEALTSRFSRVTDILIQKVYRAIDKAELENQGTILDVINQAHKRGLIDDVDTIRQLKDLRNSIAHEYTDESLIELFQLTLTLTPILLEYVAKVRDYIQENQHRF